MEVGSNHWVVAWGAGSADPFANGYQNVTGSNPWRSEFLEETAFYTVHRFMDWNRTNNSNQIHWSERTQQNDAKQDPVAYEGGQHVLQNADSVNRDPAIYDYYATYLEGIDDYLGVFAHYAHAGSYSSGGAWGAKEAIGLDMSETHKYRALFDYAAGHTPVTPPPPPPPTSDYTAPTASYAFGDGAQDDPPDPGGSDDDPTLPENDSRLGGGCSMLAARTGTGLSTLLFLVVVLHTLWDAWRRTRRRRN